MRLRRGTFWTLMPSLSPAEVTLCFSSGSTCVVSVSCQRHIGGSSYGEVALLVYPLVALLGTHRKYTMGGSVRYESAKAILDIYYMC